MSPPTIGLEAVAVLKGNSKRQSSLPSSALTETRPDCVKKMTCDTPWIVAGVGVAWVIFSLPLFHASLPSDLLNARNDCPAPPPATMSRSPITSGDAALPHFLIAGVSFCAWYSLARSFSQTTLPLAVLRQASLK